MTENKHHKLKISQLQALVTVADCGNFSLAALHLDLSQSTVSHAIATLEEELGVVLLMRGRYGAKLTPVGEQVIQEARQVLQLLESIEKKATIAKGLQGGQVRVASIRSVATHVLPAVIALFREKFSTIGVAIAEYARYVEVEQALREGRADVGFTSLPAPSEFEVRELFRDEIVALLPPGLQNQDSSLSWEKLMGYPMIMYPSSHRHYSMLRDYTSQLGHTLKVDYEIGEDSTIISMVRQGLGVTVMPRLAAEPIPQGVQVRSLPARLARTIVVAVMAEALHPPAVFAFLDTLESCCLEERSAVVYEVRQTGNLTDYAI